jgi:hypothetical protein
VIEAEFFFELLMSLFACPPRLDGACQRFQLGVRRVIGDVVLDLLGGTSFGDEPASSPGKCTRSEVSGPSAVRTRIAENSACSGPLVPTRHVRRRHFVGSSRAINSLALRRAWVGSDVFVEVRSVMGGAFEFPRSLDRTSAPDQCQPPTARAFE